MHQRLFFICPTDGLEPILDHRYKTRNLYYTSLGNSVEFNSKSVGQIANIIRKNKIIEIIFVLSSDNRIIRDATSDKDFSAIQGLQNFYTHLELQNEDLEIIWKSRTLFSTLSFHLNGKIKQLKRQLSVLGLPPVKLEAQIYDPTDEIFKKAYSELVCLNTYALN